MNKKKGFGLLAKQRASGWAFLTPAALLLFLTSFYPMVQAFITSLKTGSSARLKWSEPLFNNYTRMLKDTVFKTSMGNTFLYLIIQVPIMLILAILLAQLLNNKDLKFRGLFRTLIFLPCATSLVSYALIFKTGHHQGKRQLAGYAGHGKGGHHHRHAVAMDGLQHGVLSGRTAEHRILGV